MQTEFQFNTERIWRICKRGVAVLDACKPELVVDQTIPMRYLLATAALCFGTAAQEGNLRWERQRSPQWDGTVGGFSKFQVETGSITATRNGLLNNPEDARRATQLVFNDPKANATWLATAPITQILWALRMEDNDHFGFLFCRMHYKRVSKAIPTDSILALAHYWKDYYNTYLGAGTPMQFINNWKTYCADIVASDPLWQQYGLKLQ